MFREVIAIILILSCGIIHLLDGSYQRKTGIANVNSSVTFTQSTPTTLSQNVNAIYSQEKLRNILLNTNQIVFGPHDPNFHQIYLDSSWLIALQDLRSTSLLLSIEKNSGNLCLWPANTLSLETLISKIRTQNLLDSSLKYVQTCTKVLNHLLDPESATDGQDLDISKTLTKSQPKLSSLNNENILFKLDGPTPQNTTINFLPQLAKIKHILLLPDLMDTGKSTSDTFFKVDCLIDGEWKNLLKDDIGNVGLVKVYSQFDKEMACEKVKFLGSGEKVKLLSVYGKLY